MIYPIDNFDTTHFGGVDVGIYFEDTLLEEATSLQYTLMEQRTPYYGYGSKTFRLVAGGARMVQGSLTLNFTSAGYLLKKFNAPTPQQTVGPNPQIQSAISGNNIASLSDFAAMLKSGKISDLADTFKASLWAQQANDETIAPSVLPTTPLTIIVRYGSPGVNGLVRTLVGVYLSGYTHQLDDSGRPVTETYMFIAKDVITKSDITERKS